MAKATKKQQKKSLDEVTHTYPATIVKAFDGDTFTALIDLGFGFTGTVQFNLANANAHELRGESLEPGRAAKKEVHDLMMGKQVVIRSNKTKLKGRYAAMVEIDGEDLGTKLIEQGHATPVE